MADSQYSAGDLNLSIRTLSANTLQSLDAVISRLNLIEKKFTKIGSLAKGGSSSSLNKNLEYIYKKDGSLLAILPKKDKKTSKDKSSSGVRLAATIYAARKLGGIVANIAQSGADFQETLNMWSVSMGKDLLPQATAFVDKMNEAYGVSKKTLMQAQATYKNMLGSLGQISDQQAYILSEGITQMALDYASLYNQTFDQATTKFQAALAGQVRPIRSVAGYDITETTLFELYRSLGGQKSMRQLNRTEKQLLSIYAIFQQMERTGATGDLAATMESFANQARVSKESMQEILSYSGLLITNFLETSGIMKTLNAYLIFMADVLEAVVNEIGAAKNFERDDIFGGITDSASEASKEVDELNGKLTGFDKFRSMNGEGSESLGIDATLIDAMAKYKSILGEAKFEAQEIAKLFKDASGFWGEDGTFNLDKWNDFANVLSVVGVILGSIFGVKMIQGVVNFFTKMIKWFTPANTAILLFVAAVGLIISAFQYFTNGEIEKGLYLVALAIGAVGLAISLITGNWIPALVLGIVAAVTAIVALVIKYKDKIKEFGAKLINTIVNAIVSGLNWLGDKLNDFLNWIGFNKERKTLINPINIGGYGEFAKGGLPDKGTMFVAGEAGAEMVYNMPNGQSGVANIQQIAQATYNGTVKALNDWWGGSQARGDIPQLEEANATGMYQAVTRVAKSYGEKWGRY